jgi:hypothetical protein
MYNGGPLSKNTLKHPKILVLYGGGQFNNINKKPCAEGALGRKNSENCF